ncbi:MAG: tetratricopeptide repeat protein [Thermoplasmatota archaeon]
MEGAVSWATLCSGAAARRIQGDFLVALWQWDAEVESAAGIQRLPSGQEPVVGGQTKAYPHATVSRDRQVLLTVLEGDFALPEYFIATSQAYLFKPNVHVQAPGNVTLLDAKGSLAEGKELNSSNITVSGTQTVSIQKIENKRIPVQLLSPAPSTGSATLLNPSHSLAWLWLLCLPALAAVPMWLVWRRQGLLPQSATAQGRARAMDLFGHAETFAFEGGFRRARLLLDKAIRLDGLRPDLFALRARCLAMLGDTDAALRDHLHAHEAFPAGDPDAKASNAYEAARTCNQAGRRDEALSWLHLAAQYDPYILDDARDDPALLSLFTSISGRPRRAER